MHACRFGSPDTSPDPQRRAVIPRQAAAAETADAAAGHTAIATDDVPPLRDVWARWAVLSAAYTGVGSEWGPRIYPGYGWYESDRRSGCTLFVLPGDRAVLSGGKWNSELLDAAYNGGSPLPDLYTGAPAWVNDSVLNTRNRNGLLTFCFWWVNGQWYRGATDTSGELDVAAASHLGPRRKPSRRWSARPGLVPRTPARRC